MISYGRGERSGCFKTQELEARRKISISFSNTCRKVNQAVAIASSINEGMLYQWARKYKIYGYNGLIDKKRRKSKDLDMKRINYNNPRKLEESEYEELIHLRAENEYIKSEIEVIKKTRLFSS